MSKRFYSVFILLAVFAFIVASGSTADAVKFSKETRACLACHKALNPGITKPWVESRHAANGIGCYECHQAEKSDADALNHKGFTVSVIVSPKDCSKCHPQEVEEMTRSHHAKANQLLAGSLDNILGRVITGEANLNLSCRQCHGSKVKVGKDGKLVIGPWPNTGIGRVNPDGSSGNCVACHQRHYFSVEQARDPKTCGKCHQGPDHPQLEIYELSKHGIAYSSFKDQLNMDKSMWVLGEDYTYAPVCVTCHMGQTRQLDRTHDVGARIMWTLRPPISKVFEPAYPGGPDGKQRRADMKKVCSECHQKPWIDGFFTQFDEFVKLYNEKFAIPATNMFKFLKKNKVIDATPFNEKIEWDYFELWHHEGRVARHGASMNAPDWAHWHGLYPVALNFYFKFLPEADRLVAEKGSSEVKSGWKKLKDGILNSEQHKWIKGISKEEIEKITEFYQKRYGEAGGR